MAKTDYQDWLDTRNRQIWADWLVLKDDYPKPEVIKMLCQSYGIHTQKGMNRIIKQMQQEHENQRQQP